MYWFIQDYSRLKIYFTNGWQEHYLPKFRIGYEVNEPILTLSWTDTEQGTPGIRRTIDIDYRDVVAGYYGFIDDPTSAEDLRGQIAAFEQSAWTDIQDQIDAGVYTDGVTITGDGTAGDPLTGHSAAGANLWAYRAKTSATSGNPASGYMLWNNATQTSATQINLSHLTDDDFDIDLYFPYIVTGDELIIQDRNDSTNYQIWTVSGATTIHANSYIEIPVILSSSGGTGTTNFSNNHQLFIARFGSGGSTPTLSSVLAAGNTTSGTDISVTSGDDIILNGETASRIAIIDASKMVKSADTATYPSLTELSYVKGVTSAIQTQLGKKAIMLGQNAGTITHSGTAAETKIFSISVPANTVGNNDIIEVFALARRTTGAGTIQIDVYFNETDDLTTPQRVGQVVTAANQTILTRNQHKWLNTNNSTNGTPTHGMSSVFGTAAYTTTIDNTSTFYIVFSCTLGTGTDTGTIYMVGANHYKAQ